MTDVCFCRSREPHARDHADPDMLVRLTSQQRHVLALVGKALSNKAIAQELDVAETTVKAHLSVIFKLTRCRNRVEVALLSQGIRVAPLYQEKTSSQT